MKDIDTYTIAEIDEIWHDMQPGSLTKAYLLMKIRCENLEAELRQVNGIDASQGKALHKHIVSNNEVAVCDHPISYRKRDSRFNLKCTKCNKIL